MKRLIIGLICTSVISMHAQTTNYKAHAVFVYSIAKYSQWPSGDGDDFVITVLGKSKLYDEIDAVKNNHTIGGAKVSVLLAEDISQVKKSSIVVVTDGKSNLINDLVKSTAGQPVMIITEREGLHKKGAGVSFFVNDQGKLNFDLNMTDMNKRMLSLSKSLAGLAASIL